MSEEIIKKGYTRVTDALKIIRNKDQDEFKRSVGAERFEATMNNARDRGKRFHLIVEQFVNGEVGEEMIQALKINPNKFYECLTLFREYWKANVKKKIYCEKRLYCPKLKITGRIDNFVQLNNGQKALIDIKFTAEHLKNYHLQTSAYQYLIEAVTPHKVDKRFVFRFYTDGKMKVTEHKNPVDFMMFRSALNLTNYFV